MTVPLPLMTHNVQHNGLLREVDFFRRLAPNFADGTLYVIDAVRRVLT